MSTVRHAYLGTSEFAAIVLRALSGSEYRPALVVTPPDRPKGRGRKTQPPPVALAARELEIDLLQTESVNEAGSLARIRDARPTLATVCAFGQLIREPLLSEIPLLNAHPSLLPRWRGAAPIERAIMAGDERTGVTVIRLVEALDAGPMALAEPVSIGPDESYGELADRLAGVAGSLLARVLDQLAAGELALTDQDDAAATYAEKIDAADRRLEPSRPAVELAAQVRALTPHIGVYLELDGGQRLGVSSAGAEAAAAGSGPGVDSGAVAGGSAEAPGSSADSLGASGPLAPGRLDFDGDVLRLGTAEGALVLREIRPAGGRGMSPADYLRGNVLPGQVGVRPLAEDGGAG